MFKAQTLAGFLDNPMGKGSSVIMNRNQIKEFLNNRYDSLINKFGNFKCTPYVVGGSYFFHLIIPSESERRNTYDVVVEFVDLVQDETDTLHATDKSLKNYKIRLFSNCPSFTFTYAYVYNEYGIMVNELQNKYKDENLTGAPSTRNPGEIVSFEKSTYFACRFLAKHPFMLDKAYAEKFKNTDIKKLIKAVRDTDTIMLEIKKEEKRLEREGGNKGFVKVSKTTKRGKVYGTKLNKDAGVDRTSQKKEALKKENKTTHKTNVIKPKKNTTNIIKPKAKIKPTRKTTKKK